MPDDKLTAALAEFRERQEKRAAFSRHIEATFVREAAETDVRRLLAALEKALKRAADWESKAEESRAYAARKRERGNAIPAWISEASADAREDCVQTLREAITRELTGKDDDDGRL